VALAWVLALAWHSVRLVQKKHRQNNSLHHSLHQSQKLHRQSRLLCRGLLLNQRCHRFCLRL
jgi:hypothetical protein